LRFRLRHALGVHRESRRKHLGEHDQPRVVEESTVVTPPPSEDTTVIERQRRTTTEDR
jgi:hypothetical protein